jgi:hypothetical protein
MKFSSQILQQASGSVGGATYSHNKGGMYIRQKGLVKNPNTPQQQAVKAAFTTLTQAWSTTLTAAQRTAWTVYAKNVPMLNALGQTKIIPAMSMYVRCNTPRLQAGLAVVNAGPTIFALGSLTSPAITACSATASTISFTNTDGWATTSGGALLTYSSKPQNPGKTFFKGPFQYSGKINGSTATPPTSPKNVALPFPTVSGQQIFQKFQGTQADGRLTTPIILAFQR